MYFSGSDWEEADARLENTFIYLTSYFSAYYPHKDSFDANARSYAFLMRHAYPAESAHGYLSPLLVSFCMMKNNPVKL
jgi:hypothetical protein